MEASRRLEEQRREHEYKLLAAYQKLDRSEAAAAAASRGDIYSAPASSANAVGVSGGVSGDGTQQTGADAKWKDDQIA